MWNWEIKIQIYNTICQMRWNKGWHHNCPWLSANIANVAFCKLLQIRVNLSCASADRKMHTDCCSPRLKSPTLHRVRGWGGLGGWGGAVGQLPILPKIRHMLLHCQVEYIHIYGFKCQNTHSDNWSSQNGQNGSQELVSTHLVCLQAMVHAHDIKTYIVFVLCLSM